MQYRLDDKTGNQLSVLGFGCMRFPRGANGRIDRAKTEDLILSAINYGINYFDTASTYGGSEEILGEILPKNQVRHKIFLATKMPLAHCKRPEDFDHLFMAQLNRLKTHYIDYYLLHNLADMSLWNRLREIGAENWIARMKAAGHIRRLGFSFHGPQKEFLALLDAFDWDFCQIQYNYMNENYQAGRLGLHKASQRGLPVLIMEPLLGGKLADGLPPVADKLLRDAPGGYSPAAWALRWLWNQPEVTLVLSGMNSEAQLIDNVRAAHEAVPSMLSREELFLIGRAADIFRESFKIPCTGCNYCMPCPHKVNIPGCFTAYNMSYATGFVCGLQHYLTSIAAIYPQHNCSGRRCVKCGKCEKQCPQHIKITQALDAVTQRMEPSGIQAALQLYHRLGI
ncbi:MAG: aldo/keto reductase [Clostridiales bacterium]|nr:aldo/keto reductase [Clostridiales bacterium]